MIQLKNVRKSFKDKLALGNLSIQIKAGEIYGLLGSNGAGKSTTINLILGFYKPDFGHVEVKGLNPNDNKEKTRSTIGYIPENVNLYTYLSGLENLDYFCKLAGLVYSKSELKEILITCGLNENVLNKRVGTYSKGMRQKVGIAIAVAKKANIYLLDEPASGLDPAASNELSSILKKIATEGATVLLASHDIFRVRETCDRIGILKDGQMLREILAQDVTSNELENIYLDYMRN
ncbi:MAG: ABC transporter ATP-binding protein [Thalassobius sp.]|nr:ABC transporter ATP-binding protein [Thalassovita sp.]